MKYLIFCTLLFLTSCNENLIRLKSEVEANRILLSLRDSGISATKALDASEWLIKVKSTEFTEALAVLEQKRLYNRIETKEKGESSKGDMFASRAEKNSELLDKISRDLSLTMLMFPGVVDAKVHIFKAESDILSNNLNRDSASVVLITEGGQLVDHLQIKLMVSKSSGVPTESVAVIEQSSQRSVEKQPIIQSVATNDWSLGNIQSFYVSINKIPKLLTLTVCLFLLIYGCLVLINFIRRAYKKKKELKIISKIAK